MNTVLIKIPLLTFGTGEMISRLNEMFHIRGGHVMMGSHIDPIVCCLRVTLFGWWL